MILRILIGLLAVVLTVLFFAWPMLVWGVQIGAIVIFCTWGLLMVLITAWTIGDAILEKPKEDCDGS